MDVGELPRDITLLASEQLGEKFTVLTAWAERSEQLRRSLNTLKTGC
jgi:hypothetical protein